MAEAGGGGGGGEGGGSHGSSAPLRRVCVYCGSKLGRQESYALAAAELGKEIAARGLGLVYGGGSVGLMGVVAKAVYNGGGSVIGIIPGALESFEISGSSVGEIRVVKDMHERKAQMAAEADAFVALPGGFGTLEELLEMITWSQLGIHSKPVAVLNVGGYFTKLLDFFDNAVAEGFLTSDGRDIVMCGQTPSELLDLLQSYAPTHRSVVSKESWQVTKLGYADEVLQHPKNP